MVTPIPDPTIQLVTVFRTNDPGLAGLAKSILDSAHIDHVVMGEDLRNIRGWGLDGFGVGPAEFQVRQAEAQAAIDLLSELQ